MLTMAKETWDNGVHLRELHLHSLTTYCHDERNSSSCWSMRSGVALFFIRPKSANLLRTYHEVVIYMSPDETYSACWIFSNNSVQKTALFACGAERLLTRRKQDYRLSTHLGVLSACFDDGFVLGAWKESLWDLLSWGKRWGGACCLLEELRCSLVNAWCGERGRLSGK